MDAPKIKQDIEISVSDLSALQKLVAAMKEAAQAAKDLNKDVKGMAAAMKLIKKYSADLKKADADAATNKATGDQTEAAKKAKKAIEDVDKAVDKSTKTQKKGTTAKKAGTKATEKATRATKKNRKEVNRASAASHALAGSVGALTGSYRNVTTAILFHARSVKLFAVLAAVGTIRSIWHLAVRPAAEYDKQLAMVRKTTGLTAEATDKLGRSILQMSNRLAIPAMELAKIAEVAGQLGIRGTQNLMAFTKTVGMMSEVAELDAERAAKGIAKVAQAFQLPIREAQNMGSVINELSNNTTATSAEIIQALGKIGPVAQQMGLTLAETAGMVVTLIDTGLVAPRVGTNLRNLFVLMQSKASHIAKIMGQTMIEYTRNLREDTLPTVREFLSLLKQMENSVQAETIRYLFGQENFAALQALSELEQTLTDNIDLSNDAYAKGTSLIEEYGNAIDNLGTRIDRHKNRLKNFGIGTGLSMKEGIEKVLDTFGELVYPVEILEATLQKVVEEKALIEASDELMIKHAARYRELLEQQLGLTKEMRRQKVEMGDETETMIELAKVQFELDQKRAKYLERVGTPWERIEESGIQEPEGGWLSQVLSAYSDNAAIGPFGTGGRATELNDLYKNIEYLEDYKESLRETLNELDPLLKAELTEGEYLDILTPQKEAMLKSLRSDELWVDGKLQLNKKLGELYNERRALEKKFDRIKEALVLFKDPTGADKGGYVKDIETLKKALDSFNKANNEAIKGMEEWIAANTRYVESIGVAADKIVGLEIEDRTLEFDDAEDEWSREWLKNRAEQLSNQVDLETAINVLQEERNNIANQAERNELEEGFDVEGALESIDKMIVKIKALKSSMDQDFSLLTDDQRSKILSDFEDVDFYLKIHLPDVYDSMKLTDEEIKQMSLEQLKEYVGELEEAIEAAGEEFDYLKEKIVALKLELEGLKRLSDDAVLVLDSVAGAADAFGLLSQNAGQFVDNMVRAIERTRDLAIEMRKLRFITARDKDGRLLNPGAAGEVDGSRRSTIASGVGVVMAVLGMAGGIVSAIRKSRAEAREQSEEARQTAIENRKRLEEAIDRLLQASQFGGADVKGEQAQRIANLIQQYQSLRDAQEDETERSGMSVELWEAAQELLRALEEAGVVEEGGVLPDAGQLDILLNEFMQLGRFRDSIDGLLESISFLSKYLELDALESFRLFMEAMQDVEDIPDEFKEALKGIDLSTPEGQEQLKELVAMWAQLYAAGDLDLGGMTGSQFEDWLSALLGFAEGRVPGEDSNVTTVGVQRTITDVQANAIILLMQQQVFWTKQIADRLIAAMGGQPVRSSTASGIQALNGLGANTTSTAKTVITYNTQFTGDIDLSIPVSPDDPDFQRAAGQALEAHLRRHSRRA